MIKLIKFTFESDDDMVTFKQDCVKYDLKFQTFEIFKVGYLTDNGKSESTMIKLKYSDLIIEEYEHPEIR
jgi:hypothetical protein